MIEERGFDALTVSEITDRALVSRAAFYRNYRDKYDLVEQIFDEAMRALFTAVADMGPEHPPQIWVRFFEHIAEYERLYRALLGRQGSPWFVIKMRASLAAWSKSTGAFPTGSHPAITSPFPSRMSSCLILLQRCLWKPSPGGLSRKCPILPGKLRCGVPYLSPQSSRKRAPGNKDLLADRTIRTNRFYYADSSGSHSLRLGAQNATVERWPYPMCDRIDPAPIE